MMTVNNRQQDRIIFQDPTPDYDDQLLDRLIEGNPDVSIDRLRQQLELEQLMRAEGLLRQERIFESANALDNGSQTVYGKKILRERVHQLALGVQEMMADVESGKAGFRSSKLRYLHKTITDYNVIAYIALKSAIDCLIVSKHRENKHYTVQYVALHIGQRLEEEAKFRLYREKDKESFAKAYHTAMQQTKAYSKRHSLGVMMTHAEKGQFDDATTTKPQLHWEDWPKAVKLGIGLKLLHLVLSLTGIATILRLHSSTTRNKQYNFMYHPVPTPEFTRWTQDTTQMHGLLNPVTLPCVIPPRDHTTPFDGGYHTPYVSQYVSQLVKTRDKGHLARLSQPRTISQMSPVYEAVNIAQRTPWRINARILDVMQTMWDADMHHGGVPNRDDLPMPVCPRCGKVPEKREHKHTDDIAHECFRDPLVFKAWNHEARMTHRQNARLVSHRLMLMKILWTAGKLKDAPRIYFPYQIDFRGRLYAIPQFLNPQGSDLAKGLLEFAEAKPIMSKEAADWLAIHVANTWGEDKISFGDRVQWVKDHEDMLRAVVLNPLSNLEWTDADSPFCFLSAAIDWVGYLDEGFGHLSRTPIAQDGTCSGLQHYSALLRDEVGGKAVNLLPSVKPQDVYAVVADKALENMKALTVHDDNYEMAQKWINSGIINRKTTKRAVMTLPYGVTYRSARNYIRDYILDVQENHPEKIPWEPDELGSAISYLSTAVWEAIGEVVIAAPKAMKWLREVGKAAVNLDANAPVYWRSPSGLPILQTYKDLEYRRVKTILSGNVLINTGADCAGSLEEKSVRIDLTMAEPGDTVDKHRQISAFAPNFIHALDASALVFAVVKAYHDDGIQSYALIHDSFGTHAGGEGCGDSARLAKSLRKAFIDMYRTHDVLQNLLDGLNLPSEALEQVLPIPAKGGLNLNDIEQSPYFFA